MKMRRLALALPLLLLPLYSTTALAQQTGEGPKPKLVFEPDVVRLASAREAGQQTVKIKNEGNAPLEIRAIRLAPGHEGWQLSPAPQGLPATLAPGQSTSVTVAFSPDGKRAQAFAGLQVVSNDPSAVDDPLTPEVDHVSGLPMRAGSSWLLTIMVFFPLLGIPFLFLVPKGKESWTRWIAVAATLVPMIAAIFLATHFDSSWGVKAGNGGMQYIEHHVWVKSFNVEYYFGVDGISVLMLILTALVSLIAVGASWSVPLEKSIRGYFTMFLLLETGMMGVFASVDFFLFYVFWEVMLLPMYFLIGIWGGPRKEYAAIKFFLYTLAGSVLMLLALIALYYNSAPTYLVDGTPAKHTFDIIKLTYANSFANAPTILGMNFQHVVWIALFIGFAIKVPMFPFHTWLPDAHVEAPTAISVILAGVLLKMGTYGMMRINFPILPEATQWAAFAVAAFGVINILYGAFCAMAQRDLKKLVAYSSVSHMGYCLLGMAAFTGTGMSGAMMQMFNHGTITSMLFMLVGVIYDRAHTRGVDEFGGVAQKMPIYTAFFGFAFMASLGLPGLSGFIGEALVFLGSFPTFKVMTILAATGVIITAGYHLWAIQRIHLGKFNPRWEHELSNNDMNPREWTTLLPLAAIVLILGFYPMPVLDIMKTGVGDLVNILAHGQGAAAVAGLP